MSLRDTDDLKKLKQVILSIPPIAEAKNSYYTYVNSEDIRKSEETRRHRLDNDGLEANLNLKKGICSWVKWVISIYLVFIAGIIAVTAYNNGLSDTVLSVLLTTTTINILGLPLMIILSLFPNSKKIKE